MATFIDDQDLSKVVYTGTWIKGGSPSEHAETVASSTNVGDYFTVTFRGTAIAVYGTFDITSKGVVASYSIDGAPPAQVTAQAGSGDTFNQQFWRSEPLSLAEHKLVVNMTKVNFDPQPGEGTVWFDYFLITDPTITSTSGGPDPTASLQKITNSSAKKPIGAIVGAIIGGLGLMLAAMLIFLLFRRRKQHPHTHEESDDGRSSAPSRFASVEPFMLNLGEPSSVNSISTTTHHFDPTLLVSGPPPVVRKRAARTRLSTIRSSVPNPPESQSPSSDATSNDPSSIQSSLSDDAGEAASAIQSAPNKQLRRSQVEIAASLPDALSSSQSSEPSQPRQHVDSGARAVSIGVALSPPVELPPVYSPI
ncbi:hypothetical protein Hypma_002823 [Hypsizygus marmoreus]|uniref:Uncharacterized protein n=1 Tax=Hypsizygus marmoreus TaxID=39966 RepID=A0A369JCI3_HYPMA|nr:hypothetical protein Hypma_002823 [Hypsizygus marmoreus]